MLFARSLIIGSRESFAWSKTIAELRNTNTGWWPRRVPVHLEMEGHDLIRNSQPPLDPIICQQD